MRRSLIVMSLLGSVGLSLAQPGLGPSGPIPPPAPADRERAQEMQREYNICVRLRGANVCDAIPDHIREINRGDWSWVDRK